MTIDIMLFAVLDQTVPYRTRVLLISLLLLLLGSFTTQEASAQRQEDTGVYIDPERADPNARRVMVVNSNQVETEVTNYGTVARGGQSPIGGIWPRGTGHDHLHEMSAIIGARVINGTDTTIIISDGYSEANEIDPQTNVLMKFHPLAGYVKIDARQGRDCKQLELQFLARLVAGT